MTVRDADQPDACVWQAYLPHVAHLAWRSCEPTNLKMMLKMKLLACAVIGLLSFVDVGAKTPINKCVVNGAVTYQSEPCPTTEARRVPTVEELNLEQKKRREAAAAERRNAAPSNATSQEAPRLSPGPDPLPFDTSSAAPKRESVAAFRCDGRQYCSQMTSCAEAKYFLKHCPGVKMDGDGNGIPCEQQWCGR